MSAELSDLYAGPWQDFVARRKELAASAKAGGDADLARTILALKKPTRGAWVVNLVARFEADRLAEVFDLGEQLARAHRDADPDELRRLSTLRAAVVNSLTGRGVALAAERGYAAPDSVRQEVAETLQAAMADPDLADDVLAGTMAATVRAAGFGPTDLFPAARLATVVPLRPRTRARDAEPEPARDEAPRPDPAEVRRLSRDLGRAEARLEEAQERHERAETAATEAAAAHAAEQQQVDDLAELVEELTQRLEAAAADQDAARTRLAAADRVVRDRAAAVERSAAEITDLTKLIEATTARLTELGVEF